MSNNEPWLQLAGQRIAFADLHDATPASTNESEIISFCRSWIDGQPEFTLTTSGSTGAPKQINVTRLQVERTAELQQEALGLREGMNALLCLDHRFIAGKMMMVRCLTTGMNLVITKPAANPAENIPTDIKIDFAALVPYQLEHLIASKNWSYFSNKAKLIIGGATINTWLSREMEHVPVTAYATFGMTETISHIALHALNGKSKTDSFETLHGVTVSVDERNCLVIHAAHLNRSPIVTNDIVEILDSTRFKWRGRWDNVINSGGVKVIPERVETVVAEVFSKMKVSNRFFVAGLPDTSLGEVVTLFIEGTVSDEVVGHVNDLLESSVDRFERPRKILTVQKFTETATGKINRSQTIKTIPK